MLQNNLAGKLVSSSSSAFKNSISKLVLQSLCQDMSPEHFPEEQQGLSPQMHVSSQRGYQEKQQDSLAAKCVHTAHIYF